MFTESRATIDTIKSQALSTLCKYSLIHGYAYILLVAMRRSQGIWGRQAIYEMDTVGIKHFWLNILLKLQLRISLMISQTTVQSVHIKESKKKQAFLNPPIHVSMIAIQDLIMHHAYLQ